MSRSHLNANNLKKEYKINSRITRSNSSNYRFKLLKEPRVEIQARGMGRLSNI